MFRKSLLTAIAVCSFVFPAQLMAGGPPWLCLPVDGVSENTLEATQDKLSAALRDKIWDRDEAQPVVKLQRNGDQWYVVFHMRDDVTLTDIRKALDGSELRMPLDQLHLFGHVILEIDVEQNQTEKLLGALKALNYVSVADSTREGDTLLVTVDMPYPDNYERSHHGEVAWERFVRTDFSSPRSTRTEQPAKATSLPGYDKFTEIVEDHRGSIKNIRWSVEYACRPLGGVAVPSKEAVAATSRAAR